MRFEIRESCNDEGNKTGFAWCLIAHSGHEIAHSPRAYRSRAKAVNSVQTIRAGAGLLMLGFVVATAWCFSQSLWQETMPAVESCRRALGRVVLIGLEVLAAATIITTITVDPTVEGLGLLVAIRTALGWTMVLEVSGRWPW
ncbi:MAG: DUF1622 domain-containing protein [Hyphomicrobiales bacterium]